MKIEAHTLLWREPDTLRVFLNHYTAIADSVVVWLYEPSDEAREIVRQYPNARVRPLYSPDGLCTTDYAAFRNICWRESDADWLIVVDPDEWIWHPNLRHYLAEQAADVLRCRGFNCTGPWSDFADPSRNDWVASFDFTYCKPSVFRNGITFLNLMRGGHDLRTTGQLEDAHELLLLHGKWMGGTARVLNRLTQLQSNISPREPNQRWKNHTVLSADFVARHIAGISKRGVLLRPMAEHWGTLQETLRKLGADACLKQVRAFGIPLPAFTMSDDWQQHDVRTFLGLGESPPRFTYAAHNWFSESIYISGLTAAFSELFPKPPDPEDCQFFQRALISRWCRDLALLGCDGEFAAYRARSQQVPVPDVENFLARLRSYVFEKFEDEGIRF